MQRLPHDQLMEWLSDEGLKEPDIKTLAKRKKESTKEFRKQLTIGYPTDADEAGLKRLVKQLREGRLRVKLFLRHALHAKLYLAHRCDTINPVIAYPIFPLPHEPENRNMNRRFRRFRRGYDSESFFETVKNLISQKSEKSAVKFHISRPPTSEFGMNPMQRKEVSHPE